jgi:hypothetical protein
MKRKLLFCALALLLAFGVSITRAQEDGLTGVTMEGSTTIVADDTSAGVVYDFETGEEQQPPKFLSPPVPWVCPYCHVQFLRQDYIARRGDGVTISSQYEESRRGHATLRFPTAQGSYKTCTFEVNQATMRQTNGEIVLDDEPGASITIGEYDQ